VLRCATPLFALLLCIQEHEEQCAALERQMQQLNEQHAIDVADQQQTFTAKRN